MKKILFCIMIIFLLGACTPSSPPVSEPTELPAVTDIPAEAKPAEPASNAPTGEGFTIVDALGREVSFAKAPTRIVVTGRALFMVLDAVYSFPQASERIVAIGNAAQGSSNFISLIDPNYDAKTLLQSDAGAEQIAATQPDLVILKSSVAETIGKPLEELNIPVVYIDFETPDQYERDMTILGKIFQSEDRANEVLGYFTQTVEGIQTSLQDVAEKPSVLMLYYTDKDGAIAFNVPPMEWMQTQIVQIAGGSPVWADANPAKGWTKVTLEQIAAWDADNIYIIAYTANPVEVVAQLKEDPQWKSLRAVKENRLFAFPGDLYSWDQPDTRWALGVSWLAANLHPDKFPDFDILETTSDFYQTLYNLDAKFIEEKIQPTFRGVLP